MGCNCGKKSAATVRANQAEAPKPPQRPVVQAGGKPLKGVTQSFSLGDGPKLEADAARVRAGGHQHR